jgi:hypothetical protein
MEKKRENVVVFTGQIARQLLKLGFTIVDIKADKLDPEGKRSVFVFKDENDIRNKIKELVEG